MAATNGGKEEQAGAVGESKQTCGNCMLLATIVDFWGIATLQWNQHGTDELDFE